jgi:hypothetical protein
MKYYAVELTGGRAAVVYTVPSTGVRHAVTEAPVAAMASLTKLAAEMTAASEPGAYVLPEDRPIVTGFYGATQGDLF